MAKTKATKDVKVAASNDSKLITQGGLNRFATKFWDKIKRRYDGTFKSARLTESDSTDKKLIFTKTDDTEAEVDLRDYVRLQDKNEFKQDVSADNVAILSNRHIGTSVGSDSRDRSLGFRQLTTNSFSDRYIDHIRVYVSDTNNTSTSSRWFVWAIKKGANGKEGDTVAKVICNNQTFTVDTVNENSVEKRFVKIPVNQSFEDDVYFIVRCATHKLEVVSDINDKYKKDVVNMNSGQPPMTQDELINWGAGINADGNTALMYLFGRESIGTLSLKLNKLNSDSGLYVKHSETTAVGGNGEGGKVAKLDNDGKLNKNMLPSIAINEYFEINDFSSTGLRDVTYENGDVVVVNNNTNINHGKKYLCIKKRKDATANSTDDFIELNSKDGSVLSVNEKTGAVNLELEATTDKLKLKITGAGGTAAAETAVDIVTNNDIDSIIDGLTD